MLNRSVFNPVSPQALAISNLFVGVIIVATLVVLFIAGVLAYTTVRYRARPGDGDPPQQTGVPKLEIAWTVIPLLIVTVIFILSIGAMAAASPGQTSLSAAAAANPNRLRVIGHQWWWEIRYPSGVVTANEIHIPVGTRYVVALNSADVIHDFWLPQCGPKMDLVPQQTNYLWLECDRQGTYEGACTEYCGTGHAWMLLRVIVESRSAFDRWRQGQLRVAPAFNTGLASQGQRLFSSLSCQSCHTINGLPGASTGVSIGPDLTHFASRQTLGGGRTSNTVAHLEAWLANPDVLKPGVHMPNFQLDKAQDRALATYLETLR